MMPISAFSQAINLGQVSAPECRVKYSYQQAAAEASDLPCYVAVSPADLSTCEAAIETVAKRTSTPGYAWTKPPLSRWSTAAWKDQKNFVVTYTGNQIKVAYPDDHKFRQQRYECVYDHKNWIVREVRLIEQ